VGAKIVVYTPGAEQIMAYCARVSSDFQTNTEYTKLFTYCLHEGHWSVFEQASMTVEIETSRAIAAQLLRHRSFTFQEFSQRYQVVPDNYFVVPARAQDAKNRQSSHDTLDEETKQWFANTQRHLFDYAHALYETALSKGIAKECARNLLPMATSTKLYMTGSARSWIHYLKVRLDKSTQKEHRDIAEEVFKCFEEAFPVLATLLVRN
jgi:thymidylate synthase (FAD)